MAPRKKVATAEPTPVSIPVGVWAREVITRLYVQRYGREDTQRIGELVTLYTRILSHEGIHEVRPDTPATEDTPIAEKPKRKGGRPKKIAV